MRVLSAGLLPVLGLGAALLTGCGGSGSSSASQVSPVYTGPTTAASIQTYQDVNTLAFGAVYGSTPFAALDGGASVHSAPRTPSLAILAQMLASQIVFPAPSSTLTGGVAGSPTQVTNGVCGGTMTSTGTDLSSGGNYKASMSAVFSHFCVPNFDGSEVYVDGSMSGIAQGAAPDDFIATVSTPYLAVTASDGDYIYNLSETVTVVSGSPSGVVLSADFQAPDGKVYRVANYVVSEDTTNYTISVQGTFYNPAYGSVAVTTPTDLGFGFCDDADGYVPTSGSVQVTGAAGNSGTFTGNANCTYVLSTTIGGTTLTSAPTSWTN